MLRDVHLFLFSPYDVTDTCFRIGSVSGNIFLFKNIIVKLKKRYILFCIKYISALVGVYYTPKRKTIEQK